LQFNYPQASIQDAQATEEAFSPQKRTSNTSKHEIFVGHFCPPGSRSADLINPDPIQIRIQNTAPSQGILFWRQEMEVTQLQNYTIGIGIPAELHHTLTKQRSEITPILLEQFL
jgi:hypothetical protein